MPGELFFRLGEGNGLRGNESRSERFLGGILAIARNLKGKQEQEGGTFEEHWKVGKIQFVLEVTSI